MRAVVLTKHGRPEVLQIQEVADPRPGPHDVRIQVAAAGVNFAETMARVGLYPDAPKPPCVLGYEVAGTVVEVGREVQGVIHGQRVLAGTRFGGYAEQVAVPGTEVIPLPASLSFEQGAAIPVNYSTAWAGLIEYGGLRAGQRVLIHAAAGGVGIAATQLAKHWGAEVYGSASPFKHDAIGEQGVDHPVDYTQRGWEKELPKFDLVLDAVGGRSFRISYDLLRPGGRLVAFGASSVVSGERRSLTTALRAVLRMPRFNLIKQMSESRAVIGLNMLTLWDDRKTLQPWIRPLQALMDEGVIRPVVAGAFPFERAADAHRMLAERRNVGKVVLTP
ncbi:MAG TPA: medium chain dehydrogenase/reductase family protein [Solirubrobacteraceae bacterium]|jgi:NADPH:quinone reductase-like Zn-dependent oxidoreductase|nr:medium chain dehydrogenase/reductase family protein [Solirubrobacteraceae bacterium]